MATLTRALPRWTLNSQFLVAIRTQDVGKASKVLDAGVDVDTRFAINSQEKPALCLAVENNDCAMVQLLLHLGASSNQVDSTGESPLHIACRGGFVDLAQILLINNNPNVNARTHQGATPLLAAASYGSAELVELLISYGADVNHQDKNGQTSLHIAARCRHSDICKILLENGANAAVWDNIKNSPLHYAVSEANDVSVIEDLTKRCPQALCVANKFGETPLIAAIRSGRPSLDELLETVLMVAKETLPVMVWHNMILNHRTERGHTLLHLAVLERQVECVRVLLSAGAEVNSRNHLGQTPLISAAKTGRQDIIRLLLSAGATTRLLVCNDKVCAQEETDFETEAILKDGSRTPLSLAGCCRRSFSKKFGLVKVVDDHLPRRWSNFLNYKSIDL